MARPPKSAKTLVFKASKRPGRVRFKVRNWRAFQIFSVTVVDMTASRIFSKAEIARFVDLTDLSVVSTSDDIGKLCAKAVQLDTAAVCVWPRFVRGAAHCLSGYRTKVATVVNFPHGAGHYCQVAAETSLAVRNGADEIDLVLPYRPFIDGDRELPGLMIRSTVAAADGRPVKVILESGEMPELSIVREASEFSYLSGATFVKTSTGFTPNGASMEAAEVILHVAKEFGGSVKISGGVKTVEQANDYMALASYIVGKTCGFSPATFRFGASSLLNDDSVSSY